MQINRTTPMQCKFKLVESIEKKLTKRGKKLKNNQFFYYPFYDTY